MRRALRYIKGEEWAMVVTFLTALGAELPALAALVEGELDRAGDKFTPMGLVVLIAGFLIRSNVWSQVGHRTEVAAAEAVPVEVATELLSTKGKVDQAVESLTEQDAQIRALRLLLQESALVAQQRDQVAEFQGDPLSGRVGDAVPFVDHQGQPAGGLRPGLGHPRP